MKLIAVDDIRNINIGFRNILTHCHMNRRKNELTYCWLDHFGLNERIQYHKNNS
jgi:hypothetical protein